MYVVAFLIFGDAINFKALAILVKFGPSNVVLTVRRPK